MPRYKLIIEYDGTPFCGWQIQDNGPSVQGALEDAVKAICGEQVRVHGAGRTDAGVHALARSRISISPRISRRDTLRDALNAHLRPHPVGVLSAEIVPDDFDARFSATKRHYRLPHHQPPRRSRARIGPCLARAAPARCRRDACRRAAAGRQARLHDLPRHRMPGEIAGEDARPARCRQRDGDDVDIVTSARSFLHSQVRSMVGSLVWSARAAGAPTILPPRSAAQTAPPAARSRRRTGFIWCGWIID